MKPKPKKPAAKKKPKARDAVVIKIHSPKVDWSAPIDPKENAEITISMPFTTSRPQRMP